MKLPWLAVLGCLSALLAAGHSAAVTTPDTLVVARSEDTSENAPEATAATEATTNEPDLPIKLKEVEVTSYVSLRYAHTSVVARVKNPGKRAQEANFRVLLPETAFISGFVMTLDNKSYKAYVKEKEEAKQIYNDAVSHGFAAAHVAAKARDSNQFVVSVNVEPSSTAVFNLTYEELLVRRNGVYNHAINLHPGALVPKLSVTVHIKEAQKITDLRVPEIRTGNEVDATKDDAQNDKAIISRGHDDREATITFAPDLDEQKRLMQIYADKSKESASNTHRRWYNNNQDEEDTTKNDGVLGQFVVQYDVDRPKDGEILVNDGYFVHFFAPASLPPLNKYVLFVLDTSGSMMDRKIIQLREAMQTILSDLNPGDFFSIVEFASAVSVHDLKEADQEPPKRSYNYYSSDRKPTPLVAPSPATPENIAKAKVIISRLDAAGGTNIASALDVAVNLIHKRTEWGKPKPRTDDAADANGTTTEVAPVLDPELYNVEKMKTLEPIIIFLTDGDPTVGETNPTTIINRLTEKNYGEDKATIFSLAFGEDADRKFLRKLSLRSDGFMRHIYEAADAALQLRDFYRQVSSPLLSDVKFIYPASQVKEESLTKNKFRTFYAGSEVVVAGQLADAAAEVAPQVLAFCGVDDGVGRKRYEKLPKAPVPAKKQDNLPLERLWSYLTIKQLLDQKDATDADGDNKDNSPEKKALALALKYEFVTPLTSLVVVKPNATKAVDAESVDQQNNRYAYGGLLVGLPGAGAGFAAPSAYGISNTYAYSPISPLYSSQALSLNSMDVQEEIDALDFDYDNLQTGRLFSAAPIALAHHYRPAASWHSGSFVYPRHEGTHVDRDSLVAAARPALSWPSHVDSYHSSGLGLSHSGFSGARPQYQGFALSGSYPQHQGTALSGSYPLIYTSSTTRQKPEPPWIMILIQETASTTPALPVPTTLSTTDLQKRLIERYHLQAYSWIESILDVARDAVSVFMGDAGLSLKLANATDIPRAEGGDAECAAAVGGGKGACVYLTRCHAARNITVDLYKTHYCSVDTYAGVCCSQKDIDQLAETTTSTSESTSTE